MMYAEERQQAIVSRATRDGRVAVADLARRFDVTPETIRRDLDVLSTLGLVTRVHGGAVASGVLRDVEPTIPTRAVTRVAEKARIAEAALAFLPPSRDAALLLDAGTTVARLADLLPPDHRGPVVTNSLPAAASLASRNLADVHMLAGRVRPQTQASVGPDTVAGLSALRLDVAFVGANGFSASHGLSTPDPSEAAAKRAMIGASRLVVALVESSKLNNDYLVSFSALSQVHALVTDDELSEADRSALEHEGIEVVVA